MAAWQELRLPSLEHRQAVRATSHSRLCLWPGAGRGEALTRDLGPGSLVCVFSEVLFCFMLGIC